LPRYQSGERMGKWSCATDDGNEREAPQAHLACAHRDLPRLFPDARRVAAGEGLIATSHAIVRLLCGGLRSGRRDYDASDRDVFVYRVAHSRAMDASTTA
jgi:hypothetical protein